LYCASKGHKEQLIPELDAK